MRKSSHRIPDMRIVLAVDAGMARAFCDYFEPRYSCDLGGADYYAIDAVTSGEEALALYPPGSTIVVGENLPDMTRHEFLLKLGDKLGPEWVSRINFIFVNEESTAHEPTPTFVERYWEIGKPLDFVNLEKMLKGMRIHGIWADPTTHLPSGRAIENHLKELLNSQDWALLFVELDGMDAYAGRYGWVASDGVVRFAADVLEEVIDRYSAPTDFIGHIGSGDFVVIVPPEKAEDIVERLQVHFVSGVQQCYPSTVTSVSSPSRATSALHKLLHHANNAPNPSVAPPLNLAIGIVRSTDGPFANINEIMDKTAASLWR
jgi:GGDEF domain-containing protein